MKKILQLLLFAFVFIPTTIVLADDDDKPFYKGIRVGWQQSNISNSEMGDLSSFYAGFFGVKKIGAGKLISMYSGLEFYQTGAQENDDNKIVLSYISIPINLRVKIGPVYAFGGVNPAFKIMNEITAGGVDVSDFQLADGSKPYEVNTFDIGGQVGVGAKFLFLGVEIKYNQGFLNVFKDDTESSTTNHLQVGACVYF